MVMHGCLGDWLQDSGWKLVLSSSRVITFANDSLLSAHDVAATKYVHRVTAYTLYNRMKKAFQESKYDSKREQRNLNFEKWREQMELLYPQFQFWSRCKLIICYSCAQSNLESLVCVYIPWVSFYNGHLSLITITMSGRCPFINTTWKCCKNQILLSFTNLRLTGTLLYLEPKMLSVPFG